MPSWQSTACGVAAAIATVVINDPTHFGLPQWVVALCGFIVAGGLAGMGIAIPGPKAQGIVWKEEAPNVR